MRPIISMALIVCLFLAAVSCDRGRDISGKYKAAESPGSIAQSQLVLKADGKGTWKVDREETQFTWEQKGDEVLLHSKTGGVIVGKLAPNDSIEISLPGMDNLHFTRTER